MRRIPVVLVLVVMALISAACGVEPGTAPEAHVTDACGGATVDDHGFCRRPDGKFAKVSCCASSEICAQATVDTHGICRRKDNGQFAPVACCDALCEGTALDGAGRCRYASGQFALGACCADQCTGGSCDAPIDATRFGDDLRAALVDHYAQYGDDIVGSGGNTLAEAQEAVDAGLVVELTDPEDDPEGHDLSVFRVLSHPDVTFPGSDTFWFGAYDEATGALAAIYGYH